MSGRSTPGPAPSGPRPMRVAAVIDTAAVSGPGRQLAALALALEPMGVELHVVLFHDLSLPRCAYGEHLAGLGVRHAVLPDAGPADLRLPGRLRRALDEIGPDVVQTHGYRPTALITALRLAGLAVPWIAFFHGSTAENLKVRLYHRLDRVLMARADRLVVMSQAQRAGFARARVPVRVIHNAVVPLAEPGDAASPVPPGLAAPLIGVVGRLSPEKGVDVFLRACEILLRRGRPPTAVVAGDGPERGALESLAAALGLGDHVRFLGPVQAVAALYARLDLLVIPSRSEGLPNVLLEALRSGVPAVATRVGAIPEVLEGTRAGILVPPGSPEPLADAIERGLALKADPDSRRARRALVRRFSLEARARAHLELYADVLRARRREASP